MTTKEVAGICGVTSRTVSGNARKAGIILEDGKIHNWTDDEVRKLQLVLMNNIQNRGNAATLGNVVENTARDALQGGMTLMEIIRSGNIEAMKELMDNDFKYSKDDILQICNGSERTFRSFLAMQPISQRDFTSIGSSHKQFYNENVLKQFQAWLMKNQINQGVQVDVVKSTVESTFQSGLTIQELIRSGNVDAMKEFMGIVIEATEQQKALIESQKQNRVLVQQNTQLIEQKNAAEAETERIKQYNRNFHNSLYTATEVAKMLGVTPNRIGREAKNHNLKLEPLYGMLGKIKLDNGKLVDQFCYNDDAVRILKAIICAD